MMELIGAFSLVGVVGGGIIYWAYKELASGVKHV